MKREDALSIAFFSGSSLILFLYGVFFTVTPTKDPNLELKELHWLFHANSLIRFCFMLVYLIFAIGFCINVFVYYGINYLYIFECDLKARMTHQQFY